jgi:ApaG protein
MRSESTLSATSETVTRGIRVSVRSRYAAEHSQPWQQRWFFLYTVRIANEGPETVQLISRHWIITDGLGSTEEVRGLGVVGQQPTLEPGESFEYTSGCPLSTPFGSMRGTYQLVTVPKRSDGFDVEIAAFALEAPYTVH